MRKEAFCPFPETCRYTGGKGFCSRESCPFRIRQRRRIAGEIQRLYACGEGTPALRAERDLLKARYAALLRGGDGNGPETSPAQRPGVGSGGGPVLPVL